MHPHHGFSVKKMLEMEVRASDLTLGKYVQTGVELVRGSYSTDFYLELPVEAPEC